MESASRLFRAAVIAGALLSAAALVYSQTREAGEIEIVTEQYRQAWQRGDIDGVMQFWSADAQIVGPGSMLAGAAAIRDNLRATLDMGIYDLRHESREVYGSGDTVVEVTRSAVLDRSGRGVATMRYMSLWRKTGGQWRIHREFAIPVK